MGTSIGEAWVRMYFLDKVCRAQMNLMQAGEQVKDISPAILNQMQVAYLLPGYQLGSTQWDALKDFA